MLTNLKIKNFKAFKNEQSLRIAPITLIYGPNSAGKSSIIQSLLLLNQSIKNIDAAKNCELASKGEHLDLGMPKNYLHKGNVSQPLAFTFLSKMNLDQSHPLIRSKKSKGDDLSTASFNIEIEVQYAQEDLTESYLPLKLLRVSYKVMNSLTGKEYKFCFKITDSDKNEYSLENKRDVINISRFISLFENESLKIIKTDKGIRLNEVSREFDISQVIDFLQNAKFSAREFAMPNSLGAFFPTYLPRALFRAKKETSPVADDIAWNLNRLMSQINETVVRTIKDSNYISGLRNSPQRFYALTNARNYVGKSGEDMATLLYKLAKADRSPEVNKWLKKLDIPYMINIEPIRDDLAGSLLIIKLKDLRNKVEVTPSDVGIGISQILPLLIQGLSDISSNSSRPSRSSSSKLNFKFVEQPELHLHPRLQANLADFFISTTSSNKQLRWILETHSEALMLRIQKRIRNKTLLPEMVSVHYVNPVKGGHSEIMELRLDEEGDFIDDWPDGFFEEAYKETFQD